MDFKALIEQLERVAYEVGDSVNRYSDGADEVIQSAATAIETLLTELDVAIRHLHGDCHVCKDHGADPDSDRCTHCSYGMNKEKPLQDNWQWLGSTTPAQKAT